MRGQKKKTYTEKVWWRVREKRSLHA